MAVLHLTAMQAPRQLLDGDDETIAFALREYADMLDAEQMHDSVLTEDLRRIADTIERV